MTPAYVALGFATFAWALSVRNLCHAQRYLKAAKRMLDEAQRARADSIKTLDKAIAQGEATRAVIGEHLVD